MSPRFLLFRRNRENGSVSAYALVSPSKDSDANGDMASRITDFDSLAVPLASSGHEK
jgi:hypothetical protein